MKKRSTSISGISGLVGVVFVGLACSPAPPPKAVVAPPPKVMKPQEPKVETPARIVLRESHLKGKVDLGVDGVVYFGTGGERWMAPASAGGAPQSASTFLPEDIATAMRAADGSLLFIGESGSVYPAKKSLDAPGTKRPAPPDVRAPAAGKAAILAIASGKTLMRTTDGGVTWNKVDVGVMGTLLSLAMTKTGEGLLLVAPQRVLATTDDGATWKPIATPGIGGRRVLADQMGKLYLMGAEGNAILTSPPGLEKTKQYPEETIDFHFPGREDVTYATGVLAGSGLVLGDRYYEIVQDLETGESEVVVEELGKPATVKTLTKLGADCVQGRIGGSGSTLVAMCQRYPDGSEAVEPSDEGTDNSGAFFVLSRSDDAGKSWKKEEAKLPSANRTDVRLWVGPTGAVIVKGACLPRTQDSCDGHGVMRPSGSTSWQEMKVDGEGPSFYSLSFAPDGAMAYAVGTAGDPDGGRPPAVFTSKDGGRSFTRAKLPIEAHPGIDDDGGEADTPIDPKLQFVRRIGTVAVDIEGHLLGAAVAYEGKWYSFGTKDDGATFTPRALPPTDGLSFAGRRGYAHGIGRGFETIDGGETWSEVKAPEDEEPAVACGALGCVLGRRAIRVGWDLTKPGTPWTPEPVTPKKVVAGKAVACTLQGDWQPLPARGELNVKTIDVASGVRFAIPSYDPKDGSAKVMLVGGEPKPPVIKNAPKGFIGANELSLFTAVDAAKNAVMSMRGGVVPRGVVFARAIVPVVKPPATPPPPPAPKPPVKPGEKKPLPKLPMPTWTVEVAWWSSLTGKVHKATIKDVPQKQELEVFEVVPGGIHLGSFSWGSAESHLYFVQESGKVVTMGYPGRAGAHPYMRSTTRVGDRSVFVTFGQHGQTTAWWSPVKTDKIEKTEAKPTPDLKTPAAPAWEPRLWALWATLVDDINVEPRYELLVHGGRPAVAFSSPGMKAIAPSAFAAFLRPETDASEVFALATQKSLGAEPRACPKGLDSTRVVVGYSTGTRHAITITGEGSPIVLGSSDLVTRVPTKGGDACATTLTTVGRWGGSSTEALVSLDDMTHSLVLKRAKNEWTVRGMSCAFVDAPVPPVLKGLDGFVE